MTSIIIASYNQAEYLSDAIESALGQTVECEVIVVDDGSTDGSLEIAKKYPVRVISQVNKGMPSARNAGIMNSYGEYVLPLDSDDILQDDCVAKLELAAEETGADIVAPSFRAFGTQNADVILNDELSLEDFKEQNRIGYFSLIRRSALNEVGGFNPNPKLWGVTDYHLWIDLLKRGKKLVTLKEILVLYRTKGESMWTIAAQHEDEWRAVLKKDHPEAYE